MTGRRGGAGSRKCGGGGVGASGKGKRVLRGDPDKKKTCPNTVGGEGGGKEKLKLVKRTVFSFRKITQEELGVKKKKKKKNSTERNLLGKENLTGD